jgi:hypothetical protein
MRNASVRAIHHVNEFFEGYYTYGGFAEKLDVRYDFLKRYGIDSGKSLRPSTRENLKRSDYFESRTIQFRRIR